MQDPDRPGEQEPLQHEQARRRGQVCTGEHVLESSSRECERRLAREPEHRAGQHGCGRRADHPQRQDDQRHDDHCQFGPGQPRAAREADRGGANRWHRGGVGSGWSQVRRGSVVP